MPIVIGALGIVAKHAAKYLDKIDFKPRFKPLHNDKKSFGLQQVGWNRTPEGKERRFSKKDLDLLPEATEDGKSKRDTELKTELRECNFSNT